MVFLDKHGLVKIFRPFLFLNVFQFKRLFDKLMQKSRRSEVNLEIERSCSRFASDHSERAWRRSVTGSKPTSSLLLQKIYQYRNYLKRVILVENNNDVLRKFQSSGVQFSGRKSNLPILRLKNSLYYNYTLCNFPVLFTFDVL